MASELRLVSECDQSYEEDKTKKLNIGVGGGKEIEKFARLYVFIRSACWEIDKLLLISTYDIDLGCLKFGDCVKRVVHRFFNIYIEVTLPNYTDEGWGDTTKSNS